MPKSGNFSPAFLGSLTPAATKSKKRMRLKDMSNEEMANLFKF